MKKIILFGTILSAMFSNLTAQITINKSHIVSSGKMIIQAYDTNTYALPKNGSNFSWDFTNLKEESRDTAFYGASQWYLGASNFPTANLASYNHKKDSSYDFMSVTDAAVNFLGTYSIYNGIATVQNIKYEVLSLPSTYNSNYVSTTDIDQGAMELGIDPDGAGPTPTIDSISFVVNLKFDSKIDGYGTLKSPIGTYLVLRQNFITISSLKNFRMLTNGTWKTMPGILISLLGFGQSSDTSNNISFWTNDANVGMPLVSYNYGQGDTSSNTFSWVAQQTKASNLSTQTIYNNITAYPSPCFGAFKVALPSNSNTQLNIYDIRGLLIESVKVENGSVIDVSKYLSGVYILKYIDKPSNTVLKVQKISKY